MWHHEKKGGKTLNGKSERERERERGEGMHGGEEPKRKHDHICYARHKGCANGAAADSRLGPRPNARYLPRERDGGCFCRVLWIHSSK